MELPCVMLRTKERDHFSYQDSYGEVTNSELEAFLEQARKTVLSLEAELEKRQIVALGLSNGVSDCSEKLRKNAGNLKILGRLDDRATRLAVDAVTILKTEQTNRASKIYQTFLGDILRHCGRGLVLLCATSLGKQRVNSLNNQDRVGLVNYLTINKTALESPILDSLAEKYQISENELYKLNSNSALGTLTRKRQLSVTGIRVTLHSLNGSYY
ncbi:hypothetical protein K432DRAFT_386533 [Lepidopterella palustris CBS 459.81]|uniref:Uncharacterized protein n=1 Tax=Lepidopterella palustris CBS 459.81 TaxID=1314670 RepID=A0A8E2J9Z1_9PEZI|nr:hypothetical protein K432DRAFT_386533 [Lepidopterella palustris CBS 459.81]